MLYRHNKCTKGYEKAFSIVPPKGIFDLNSVYRQLMGLLRGNTPINCFIIAK